MIHTIFLVVTDYAFSTLTTKEETFNGNPSFMLSLRKILKKVLTRSIDLDASWKSFSLGMVKDVGTEICHLLHKVRIQFIIMQCLKLGKLLPVSGWVKDKAFLCWKEFLYTKTGHIKILMTLISVWGRKNRIYLL